MVDETPANTITLEVSPDFYTWWQTMPCSNDQGLMYIAWQAWKACGAKIAEQTAESKS